MGYRSDVVLALTNKNLKKFFDQNDDKVLTTLFDGVERHEKDDWTLFYWPSVKWYPDYADVKAVEDFVNQLEDSDQEEEREGFSYHIMGEDIDDYNSKGTWDTPFEISLNRSLDFYS